MKSEVIVLEGAQLPKKNTEIQNNRRRIPTMTETKMVQSYYCHYKLLFRHSGCILGVIYGGILY